MTRLGFEPGTLIFNSTCTVVAKGWMLNKAFKEKTIDSFGQSQQNGSDTTNFIEETVQSAVNNVVMQLVGF